MSGIRYDVSGDLLNQSVACLCVWFVLQYVMKQMLGL